MLLTILFQDVICSYYNSVKHVATLWGTCLALLAAFLLLINSWAPAACVHQEKNLFPASYIDR